MYCRFEPDSRHILLNKNPQDITIEDIKRSIYTPASKIVKVQEKCKNIHIMYIDQVFQDFWANSIVYKKINNNPPLEMLKETYNSMIINECLYPQNILNPKIEYNQRVFELLLYTQEHFIFDKWDELENLFNEYNLSKLLQFYKYLNLFFQKILEINNNYDLMRKDLIELARCLDGINYNELMFHNKFDKKDIKILKDYRNSINRE